MRVCAKSVYEGKNVHARKYHDGTKEQVRSGILLANECDCERHQKGENETERFLLVGTNDLS